MMNYSGVKEKILTRHKDRKDFATPLEVAMKKVNTGFVGELLRQSA